MCEKAPATLHTYNGICNRFVVDIMIVDNCPGSIDKNTKALVRVKSKGQLLPLLTVPDWLVFACVVVTTQ